MRRDPVTGEQVEWAGAPTDLVLSASYRLAMVVLLGLGAVSGATALAVASAYGMATGKLWLLAMWCVTFAFAIPWVFQRFHEGSEFLVTRDRVVWRRGRLQRSIERRGISFARIRWYAGRNVGDIELVRDVPTGALRRRLTIILRGVEDPARVWDLIRACDSEVSGESEEPISRRPLGQRLQPDERVLWTGRPDDSWRRYLPVAHRELVSCFLGIFLGVLTGRAAWGGVGALKKVMLAGLSWHGATFLGLMVAVAANCLVLGVMAGAFIWAGLIGPARSQGRTRYIITNRRVVISQGRDELHLDRSRIVDVIFAPTPEGRQHLFLILDGPRARAFGVSGAFQERAPRELRPVFRYVVDAERAAEVLRSPTPSMIIAPA